MFISMYTRIIHNHTYINQNTVGARPHSFVCHRFVAPRQYCWPLVIALCAKWSNHMGTSGRATGNVTANGLCIINQQACIMNAGKEKDCEPALTGSLVVALKLIATLIQLQKIMHTFQRYP